MAVLTVMAANACAGGGENCLAVGVGSGFVEISDALRERLDGRQADAELCVDGECSSDVLDPEVNLQIPGPLSGPDPVLVEMRIWRGGTTIFQARREVRPREESGKGCTGGYQIRLVADADGTLKER